MRMLACLALAGCFSEPPRPLDPDAAIDAGVPANFMFVTANLVDPATLGGLTGADIVCNTAAELGTPEVAAGTYKAWLSTSAINAIDRFAGVQGWQRPDHRPVGNTPNDLVTSMMYPPRLDEAGVPVPGDAWAITGTNAMGDRNTTQTCSNYTSTTGMYQLGYPDGNAGVWSGDGLVTCTTKGHLLCLGVDRRVVIPPLPRMHPLGFVTESSYAVLPGSTIATADAACQSAADAQALGGQYRALLATVGAAARSRFATGPWFRLDGVPFTQDLSGFDAPLVVTELGAQHALPVLFGSTDPTLPGVNTCNDWTSNSVLASTGDSGRSSAIAFSGYLQFNCSGSGSHLYCLEY